VYYHGSQPVLKLLNVTTAATDTNKSTILVEPGAPEVATNSFMYQTATDASQLATVAYGTAITTSAWTALAANGTEITPTSGDTVVAVVEVDSSNMPVAYGTAVLNIG
jgi:ABC-type Fe3+ transport system substrate-binding protein